MLIHHTTNKYITHTLALLISNKGRYSAKGITNKYIKSLHICIINSFATHPPKWYLNQTNFFFPFWNHSLLDCKHLDRVPKLQSVLKGSHFNILLFSEKALMFSFLPSDLLLLSSGPDTLALLTLVKRQVFWVGDRLNMDKHKAWATTVVAPK